MPGTNMFVPGIFYDRNAGCITIISNRVQPAYDRITILMQPTLRSLF